MLNDIGDLTDISVSCGWGLTSRASRYTGQEKLRKKAEHGSRDEIPERIPDNWYYDGGDTLELARSLGWAGRMNRPEKML